MTSIDFCLRRRLLTCRRAHEPRRVQAPIGTLIHIRSRNVKCTADPELFSRCLGLKVFLQTHSCKWKSPRQWNTRPKRRESLAQLLFLPLPFRFLLFLVDLKGSSDLELRKGRWGKEPIGWERTFGIKRISCTHSLHSLHSLKLVWKVWGTGHFWIVDWWLRRCWYLVEFLCILTLVVEVILPSWWTDHLISVVREHATNRGVLDIFGGSKFERFVSKRL